MRVKRLGFTKLNRRARGVARTRRSWPPGAISAHRRWRRLRRRLRGWLRARRGHRIRPRHGNLVRRRQRLPHAQSGSANHQQHHKSSSSGHQPPGSRQPIPRARSFFLSRIVTAPPRAPSPQAVRGKPRSAKNANRSAPFPVHRARDRSTPRESPAPGSPRLRPCSAPDFAAAILPSPCLLPAPPFLLPLPSPKLRTRETSILALTLGQSFRPLFPWGKRARQIKGPFLPRIFVAELQLRRAQFFLLPQCAFHMFANLPPRALQFPRNGGLVLAQQPPNLR